MSQFEEDLEYLDGRSIFANRILQLLYEKHNGDLDKACEEAEPFFEDLEEYIRNIYELVDSEIPLYAYYRLKKYGADANDFSDEEYLEILEDTKQACKIYYTK